MKPKKKNPVICLDLPEEHRITGVQRYYIELLLYVVEYSDMDNVLQVSAPALSAQYVRRKLC